MVRQARASRSHPRVASLPRPHQPNSLPHSDAKRPCCSTCVRSHAYAVAHAVEGTVFPDKPECTYDEGRSVPTLRRSLPTTLTDTLPVPVFDADAGNSVSRKLYEKMENKIREWQRSSRASPLTVPSADELEALVREKDRALQSLSPQIGPSATPIPAINNPVLNGRPDNQSQIYNRVHANAGKDMAQPATGTLDSSIYGQYAGPSPASSNADYPQLASTSALDSGNGVSNLINGSNSVGPSSMAHQTSSPPIVSNSGPSPPLMDDFHVNVRSWPPNLPSPELTRHLFVLPLNGHLARTDPFKTTLVSKRSSLTTCTPVACSTSRRSWPRSSSSLLTPASPTRRYCT